MPPFFQTTSLLQSVVLTALFLAYFAQDLTRPGLCAPVAGSEWATIPVYVKSRCFDPFPFPAADDLQRHRIRTIAEGPRRPPQTRACRTPAPHPDRPLQRAGKTPRRHPARALPPEDRSIFDDGLVLILKEYHDNLDAAVAAAYGWPADLSDNDILPVSSPSTRNASTRKPRETSAGSAPTTRSPASAPRGKSSRSPAAPCTLRPRPPPAPNRPSQPANSNRPPLSCPSSPPRPNRPAPPPSPPASARAAASCPRSRPCSPPSSASAASSPPRTAAAAFCPAAPRSDILEAIGLAGFGVGYRRHQGSGNSQHTAPCSKRFPGLARSKHTQHLDIAGGLIQPRIAPDRRCDTPRW